MNKLKIIDLFCGSGGFTLGFLKEKFEVQLAIDHDPYCEQVYKKNYKLKENYNQVLLQKMCLIFV